MAQHTLFIFPLRSDCPHAVTFTVYKFFPSIKILYFFPLFIIQWVTLHWRSSPTNASLWGGFESEMPHSPPAIQGEPRLVRRINRDISTIVETRERHRRSDAFHVK